MRTRTLWTEAALLAIATGLIACGGGCATTPKTYQEETIPSPHGYADAAIKTTPESHFVFKAAKGPYPDVGPIVEEMRGYAQSLGIASPTMRILYYDDPTTIDPRAARSDIGFELPETISVQALLPQYKARTIEAQKVAALVVKGPPTTTWECYDSLERWARARGESPDEGAPVLETYLSAPGTPLAEWQTEIWMPLTDKPRASSSPHP